MLGAVTLQLLSIGFSSYTLKFNFINWSQTYNWPRGHCSKDHLFVRSLN